MGLTAVLLLAVAKLWLHFEPQILLPVTFSPQDGGLGVGLGLGVTLLSALIYQLWPAYRHSADAYLQMVLQPLHWLDLPWLGLLPGLSEELLFRGVMLPSIGLTITGMVVSAASFGVLHLSSWQQWPYVIWASLIGLMLAGSAVATGNLLVPVVAHIVTNLSSSLFWKWRYQRAL